MEFLATELDRPGGVADSPIARGQLDSFVLTQLPMAGPQVVFGDADLDVAANGAAAALSGALPRSATSSWSLSRRGPGLCGPGQLLTLRRRSQP